MIHTETLDEIRSARSRDGFLYPYYGKYSIAEIVPTIARSYFARPPGDPTERRPTLPHEVWSPVWDATGKGAAQKLVLLLVDGLGYHHLVRYQDRARLLNKLVTRGEVHPLTSVFPSTTPAALTTIHSGLTPQEHGLPEWTVFFEEMDAVIETLPFRILMTAGRDTLLESGGSAEMLYSGRTIYEELGAIGVPSYTFGYYEYENGAYSRATQKGSKAVPYLNIMDLTTKLRDLITATPGPAYFFVYWGNVDTVMHKFGPHTPEHLAELTFFAGVLEQELLRKLRPEDVADTVFAMTADHGHVNVTRERIIYLNQYIALESYYQHSRKQKAIVPTGGPHDVFLFVNPGRVTETLRLLERELDGKAWVLRTEEAVSRGLFGAGKPDPRFLRRVGNVLILPRAGHHVWYEFRPDHPFKQLGCHGGLSEEEMLVPLVMARLADLTGE